MKKLLILTSVVASLYATSASAATEGNYVGIDLLRGNASFQERYSSTATPAATETTPSTDGSGLGVGLSYKYAYNFDKIFVAPGVFVEQNNVEAKTSTDSLQVKNRYGVKADIGYDLADNISPYLTVGYAGLSYRTKNSAVGSSAVMGKNGTVGGVFYGVGLKLDINKECSFNIEYQNQNFSAKTRTDGTSNYSGTFKSNFNEIKFGLLHKF